MLLVEDHEGNFGSLLSTLGSLLSSLFAHQCAQQLKPVRDCGCAQGAWLLLRLEGFVFIVQL